MRIGTPGFVAARLTEAREARGFTQTSLAELTGIKSQSISHYEQSRQSPSPEALALLSAALRLPERFFIRAAAESDGNPVVFRQHTGHLRASERIARLQAERRLGWVKEISSYLRQYVDFPAVRLPTHERSSRHADIERIAGEVRAELHLGLGPIDDLVARLEDAGCIVAPVSSECDSQLAFAQWDRGVPYLALSGADPQSLSWRRFGAAHELGHLVLHRGFGSAETDDSDLQSQMEAQADRFARAFLMPAKTFASEVWAPSVNALLTLKREWRCPMSAMVARCGEIGLFSDDQVRRAAVSLARRGWKAVEPREENSDVETPQLLARSVRLLLSEGRKDRHGILADLALNAADVEELCGLPQGYLATAHTHPALRLRSSELSQVDSPDVVIA